MLEELEAVTDELELTPRLLRESMQQSLTPQEYLQALSREAARALGEHAFALEAMESRVQPMDALAYQRHARAATTIVRRLRRDPVVAAQILGWPALRCVQDNLYIEDMHAAGIPVLCLQTRWPWNPRP